MLGRGQGAAVGVRDGVMRKAALSARVDNAAGPIDAAPPNVIETGRVALTLAAAIPRP